VVYASYSKEPHLIPIAIGLLHNMMVCLQKNYS